MSTHHNRREAVQCDQFRAFADAFVAEHGREPSIRAAVAALGGSNTTISAHKQAWLTHRERLGGYQVTADDLPPSVVEAVTHAVGQTLEPVWAAVLHEQEQLNERQNLKLAEQHEQYLEQTEAMQRAVDTHAQETQTLQDDYERLAASNQNTEESLAAVTDERNDLAQRLAASEARSEEKIATLNRACDELETSCQDADASLSETKQSLSEANAQIVALKEKFAAEQKRQDSIAANYLKQLADQEERSNQERLQLEKLVASLESELSVVRSEHNESKKELSLAHQEVGHLNVKIKELTRDFAKATKTIEQRDKALVKLQSERGRSTKDVEAQLAKMEKRLMAKLTKKGSG